MKHLFAPRFGAQACRCNISRRQATRAIGALIAGPFAFRASSADRLTTATPAEDGKRAAFMQRAFDMKKLAIARGDQPYGAVVVKNGRIIGEGISAVVTNNDPTAHAEMAAIRDAIQKIGEHEIRGAALFGTSRACSMCENAAYRAGIVLMVYGESATVAGTPKMR